MPTRPARLCPRCRQRVTGTDCPRCRPAYARSTRGHWQGGSTRAWRDARADYLAAHPWCQAHGSTGTTPGTCPRLATDLDHIDPDAPDRWDPTGWQGLCSEHHDEKSRAEAAALPATTAEAAA